jgi:glycosyltransferase involved in cell wall biosynthesis
MEYLRVHFISLLAGDTWGGSEELWSQTASHLRGKGHNVSACIYWHGKTDMHPKIVELQKRGIVVHEWNTPLKPKRWPRRLAARFYQTISGIRRNDEVVIPWHIPSDSDLVVISSPGIGFNYPLIAYCTQNGIRYVLVCQSVSESEWVGDDELAKWRTIYRNAQAVYFVSKANLECTCCQLAYRGQHFEVVHNPYKTARSLVFNWPKSSNLRKIAFVGRLQPEHKGIDLLLRAISTDAWKKRPIQLNIYGEGKSATQLREMARYLEVEKKVMFHGYASDVDQIWDENEMLILPSRHEGLPLVVIEAMIRGRPCLVTDVSGNAEYVTDSVTGFVADGATLNCVGRALERAWQDRDLWHDMGRNAFHEIRQRFPSDPVEEFTAKLLERFHRDTVSLGRASKE